MLPVNQGEIIVVAETESKPFKNALSSGLARSGENKVDTSASRLEMCGDVVSLLAARGVEWAVKLVRDTLDGKPVQELKTEVRQTNTIELVQRLEGKLFNLGAPVIIEQPAAAGREEVQPTITASTANREQM